MRWIAVLSACSVALSCRPGTSMGAEGDGLAAVAAIEDAFVNAIASAEKSVVSVARDRVQVERAIVHNDAFGRVRQRDLKPGIEDPNYVPNEFGAGIVIDPNGLILTSYHLVRGGPIEGRPDTRGDQILYVRLPDRRGFEARIFAADPRSDLAVLKIPAAGLQPIRLGDASRSRKGQFVIALGNPYAIARDGSASASWGIIGNLYRQSPADTDTSDFEPKQSETTLQQLGVLIQVDTRLELGTSGGALLNLRGELIGVTTSLAAIAGYEKSAGFALPIDEATRRIIETLRQGKEVEYGFLGVELPQADVLAAEVAGELGPFAGRFGQLGAARIQTVFDNLPAKRFGLRGGDLVLRVGDRPIHGKADLRREIGLAAPGSKVSIKVWRAAERRDIDLVVEVGKWPVTDEEAIIASRPLRDPWRGLMYDYPTARSRFFKQINSRDPNNRGRHAGVMVVDVAADSAAAAADLHVEDLVTRVNGKAVLSPREFADAVQNETGPVTLEVLPGYAAHAAQPALRQVEIRP